MNSNWSEDYPKGQIGDEFDSTELDSQNSQAINSLAIVPIAQSSEQSSSRFNFLNDRSQPKDKIDEEPLNHSPEPEKRREPIRQLLTIEELTALVLGPWQEKFRTWGYSKVIPASPPIKDYRGEVFAVPIHCVDEAGEETNQFIQVQMANKGLIYRFTRNGEILQTTEYRSAFPQEWLMEASRTRKIVKSRPAFLYSELFDLTDDEVWPQNADIAVIGDPYQACDKERVTIVEYEYADEIFPPVVAEALINQNEDDRWQLIRSWYQNFYYEDLRALDNMYGLFTPTRGNPYLRTVTEAIDACITLLTSLSFEKHPNEIWNWEDWDQYISQLRQRVQSLIDGSWNLKDYLDQFKDNPEEIEGLYEFFEFKQNILNSIGQPEAWQEFIQRWERYLDNLPHAKLRQVVPNYDEKLAQVHYWLKELPTAGSSNRVTNGMDYLDQFYIEMFQYDDTPPEEWYNSPFYSDEIASARSRNLMADGAFGFFVPGHPVSLRTRKFLETIVRRLENTVNYAKMIWPELIRQRESLLKQGISLNEETMHAYLNSFETPFLKSLFFRRMTQRAVPIHGFFPDQVDALPPQDRILALTSVTMHGWNDLDEAGFYENLNASLPYLKKGGKYILGPINQSIYFSGIETGFDTDGLTKALKKLASEGKIDYFFRKGRRNYVDQFDGEDVEGPIEYGPADVLLPGESAHCLVITRRS